jgi:hypothetical protein
MAPGLARQSLRLVAGCRWTLVLLRCADLPYLIYVPPAIIVQQAPPVPAGWPPARFRYYCDNPAGYYPYVASSNGQWREVPATPPG